MLWLVFFCLMTAPVSSAPSGYIPGRFIVKFTSEETAGRVRPTLATGSRLEPLFPAPLHGAATSSTAWNQYFILTTDSLTTVEQAKLEIGIANIERIEQDQFLDLYSWPTDPLFEHQWYLANDGQEYFGIQRFDGAGNDQFVLKTGTPDADIKIRQFYDSPPTDTQAIVVGIIDTGTDPLHPELSGRLWRNIDEIPGNGADDDHNGFVDDTIGWDMSGDTSRFTDIIGDPNVTDGVGHGTHIAGIVASNEDGLGTVGVVPWAKIMTVKIFPNAFVSIGTAGLIYAVNNGADVVNISWGTPFQALVLEDALRYARANDVFVAIAAGNTGDNTRANPAAMDSAFAVGAGNSRGYMTWFSTWGPFVDIVAPGEDILSLRAAGTDMYAAGGEPGVRIVGPDSLYYLSDGTSMAAPVAAGAAAFLLSFRPELSVGQVEDLLRAGADDMVDPLEQGDTLVGPDSVSGFGYLNITRSLELLVNGGASLAYPYQMQRYTGSIPIKAIAVGPYTGGWTLDYSVGLLSENWQSLAAGAGIPADSLLYLFNEPSVSGYVNFRLTDSHGQRVIRRIVYVNGDALVLRSPSNDDTLRYSITVAGDVFGISYDSLRVTYRTNSAEQEIWSSTQEYFDTTIAVWNASGLKSGNYTLYLRGFFGATVEIDSARVYVASSFAAGWPQPLPSRGAQSVVVADLEHDGRNEVISTSAYGLFVFEDNGELRDGFPVLVDKDMRCLPAIFDVDMDGVDEIITLNSEGIHVFNPDGSYASGWPRWMYTGQSTLFGAPTPSVVELIPGQTPVIMFVDGLGEVKAFRLNGEPYFFSLAGHYTYFPPNPNPVYFFAGNSVSSADLDGDGANEVVVNYSGLDPWSGVGVYEARTGRPAFRQASALTIRGFLSYGLLLSDLTGDSLPEIIVTGQNETFQRTLWVKTRSTTGSGLVDLPGFPKVFPEFAGWIGNHPTVADLDLDGVPEILCTFYEFDISSLLAFRANGEPYSSIPGRPEGELFSGIATFSNPIAANLLGDAHPEIVVRGGYILPGTGNEQIYIFDHTGALIPGAPIPTPASKRVVISDNFSPLIDDIDRDGLVELAIPSDGSEIYIWDYEASFNSGKNQSKIFYDNRNRNIFPGVALPTDVSDNDRPLPESWSLRQNYPNPFNPNTTIEFSVPKNSQIVVTLYNLLGQRVAELANGEFAAGAHKVVFEAGELATGIYLYRIEADGFAATKKMVLLK